MNITPGAQGKDRSPSRGHVLALVLPAVLGVGCGLGYEGEGSAEEDVWDLDPAHAPGQNMDLSHWKLTIPGPRHIGPSRLSTYSSEFLFTDADTGAMALWVDSAMTGATENSRYVRSELREMLDPDDSNRNWPVTGTHVMTAELSLQYTHDTPDQVTVLQVHGITPTGEHAPPLLRLAMSRGDLKAYVKTDAFGENDDKSTLAHGLGSNPFSAEVRIQDGRLTVTINGRRRLDRDVSFWPHHNYFKAGVYPQATQGTSQVNFYGLAVSHRLAQ